MKVGTLPWLLRHELRLWWREVSSRRGTIVWMMILGMLFAGLLAFVWVTTGRLLRVVAPGLLSDVALWSAIVIWLLGFFYAFIQAIGQSITALFDRGDLDLLMAAPISSKVVFASRLLGVALNVFLNYCPIVVPISLIALAFGVPQLLGIYPALLGLVLMATSLAMLLTLWLVQLLGARRARTVAQILTALISAVLFLGSQLPNLLQGTGINPGGVWQSLQGWFGQDALLGPRSLIWFPARAIFFEPISVLLTLLLSAGLVWLTIEMLHRSFVTGSQQSVIHKRRHVRSTGSARFLAGFNRVVLLKEWRIIWRNPYLISNVFLQILFLIPALVIVVRGDSNRAIADFSTFVTLTTVVIGESLVMSLTRICVSGEEAPDLLKASPVKSGRLQRLKLLAALIPVWLLMSPLFLILIVQRKPWWLPVLVFLGATTCAAILRLWNSYPIPLSDLFKRRQGQANQGDFLLGLLEVVSMLAWGWLGFLVTQAQGQQSVIPLVVIGLTMAIAYGRSRQLGTSLGF